MNKLKMLTIVVSIVMIVSVCFNAFLGSQNFSQTIQSSTQTKLEMLGILNQAQVAVDEELKNIGNSLIYASQQLSSKGISGDQARNIISALAANNTFIIDAATQNLENNMVVVEPSAYRFAEGKNIGEQIWINTNPSAALMPAMTPVLPLVENLSGIAMDIPIYNAAQEIIGTVSVTFDPQVLLNSTITPVLAGKSYEFIVMQTDGLTMYDSDPTKQPTNIFTNPYFASQTQLLELTHRIADEYSGYGHMTVAQRQAKASPMKFTGQPLRFTDNIGAWP